LQKTIKTLYGKICKLLTEEDIAFVTKSKLKYYQELENLHIDWASAQISMPKVNPNV